MCRGDAHLVLLLLFFFLEVLWTLTKHLAGIDGDQREVDLKEPHSLRPFPPSLPPKQGGLRKLWLNYSSYKKQLQVSHSLA